MPREPDPALDMTACIDAAGTDAAIAIIAAAFARDPAMLHFVGNAAEPDRLRRTIVVAIVRAHVAAGEPVYLLRRNGEAVGAALVDVSRSKMRAVLGILRTWRFWLRLPLGCIGRMNAYLTHSRAGSDTTSNYLVMIGVRPDMRGLGLGGTFVGLLEQAVGPGRGWSLDTENGANVPLYENLGFVRVNTVAWAGLSIHQMHKPGA
jgi:GNAT superfamily N-acetyltransferase